MDTAENEREKGSTIKAGFTIFEEDDLLVTLIDTPGNSKYAEEALRALSLTNIGLFVMSAAPEDLTEPIF